MEETFADKIKEIEKYYGRYDSESNLPIEDQLLASRIGFRALQEEEKRKKFAANKTQTTPQENIKENENINVSVNGSVNTTYKRKVNSLLTQSKLRLITELKECNYRTPPKTITFLLKELFANCHSKSGHWLYIAQHWTPRAINHELKSMVKKEKAGQITFKNPAAYFTFKIRFRKKRKGIYK